MGHAVGLLPTVGEDGGGHRAGHREAEGAAQRPPTLVLLTPHAPLLVSRYQHLYYLLLTFFIFKKRGFVLPFFAFFPSSSAPLPPPPLSSSSSSSPFCPLISPCFFSFFLVLVFQHIDLFVVLLPMIPWRCPGALWAI